LFSAAAARASVTPRTSRPAISPTVERRLMAYLPGADRN
jgi:hypothetical protein